MRRALILASFLTLGTTGCMTVTLQPATFHVPPAIGGCALTFYRLPPQVPYRTLSSAQVTTAGNLASAQEELTRLACAAGANAVVLTMETWGGRGGTQVNGVFIRTEAPPQDAPGSQNAPVAPTDGSA